MNASAESQAVIWSGELYRRLLALYPRPHRQAYGPDMAQLFRDQCRDAWAESGGWGLAGLWLRVLPDLVKTSLLEHLSSLKGRKSMFEKISEVFRPHSLPIRVFRGVFLAVFLLVFGGATIITFMLPESYASTTRITIEREATDIEGVAGSRSMSGYDPYYIQTQFEVIQSEVVLGKAIESLDLNTGWGKKYANNEKLKTTDTIGILKGRMKLRPVRNTSLIEIQVYSEDRDEAAKIANAVAETYREYRLKLRQRASLTDASSLADQIRVAERQAGNAREIAERARQFLNVPTPEPSAQDLQTHFKPYWTAKLELAEANRVLQSFVAKTPGGKASPISSLVEIVDRAQPGLRPAHPNKPRNLVLGVVAGSVLATVVAVCAAALAMAVRNKAKSRLVAA